MIRIYLLLYVCLTSFSCVSSRNILGDYSLHGQANLTLESGNVFKYNLKSEGFGHKEWSHGKWEKKKEGSIGLTSVVHNEIPVRVFEEINDLNKILIIVQPTPAEWEVNTTIRVNNIPFVLSPKQNTLILSNSDFAEVETISLEANIEEQNFLRAFVNYYNIKSEVYEPNDQNSNVFYLTFPERDFYSYFYLREINTNIIINKKGVLFWNNNKYRK